MTEEEPIALGEPIPYGVVVSHFELEVGLQTSRTFPVYLVQGSRKKRVLIRFTPDTIAGAPHDCEKPLTIAESSSPLAIASNCVGAIVCVFQNIKGEQKTKVGSAFSVAPGILITAKHNLVDLDEKGWSIAQIVFSPKTSAKHLVRNALKGIENLANYHRCSLISNVQADFEKEKVTTSLGPKEWMIAYDVAFLSVSEEVYDEFGYLSPFSQHDESSPLISLIGYPGDPPARFLDAAFPTLWTYRGDTAKATTDQLRRVKDQYLRLIFSYDDKCVSPGEVLDFTGTWISVLNQTTKMLRLAASSLNGISGGPCVHTLHPTRFVGILAGSFAGENCNFAVSVSHPAFAIEYLERVLPAFIKKKIVPATVMSYAHLWKHVISPELFTAANDHKE